MTFYSNFSDVSGKRYEVEIHSDSQGEDVDITMSGKPCTIKSSSSKLFEPVKSRSCSLRIRTTQWYFDLYEPASRGTWVKVYEWEEDTTQYPNHQGKVIFRGFLTPCAYTQSFTYSDEITLNAIDGISTAKDFKWVNTNQYMSFFDILMTILRPCRYQGNLYVPQTYSQVNETSLTQDILKELKASSGNFIDDDQERTPWTEYEIVEEIMQFLGWSLCPDGDDIWLVDYKALAMNDLTGINYNVYDIQTGEYVGTETLASTPINAGLGIAAAGKSNISIDDIYNKISISDNLYKVEEISPDIFEDDNHISVTDEAELGADQSKWSTVRRKKFLWWTWDSKSEKDYLEGTDYQTLCRLKPDSGWTHYWYKMSDMTPLDNSDGKGYYSEATALDPTQVSWSGSTTIQKVNAHGCLLQHYAYVDESHPNNVPSSVDWTDILTFFVLGPTSTPVPLAELNNRIEKKVLEYNIAEEIQWKPASGKTYITISGSLFYQSGTDYKDGKKTQRLTIINSSEGWYATTPVDKSLKNLPSDMNYAGDNCTRKESDPNYGKGFELWKLGLHIGGKSWNGNAWVDDTDGTVTFKLSFNNSPDNEKDEYIPAFQWMNIVNNHNFKDKVGEDAYAIPIDSEIATDPTFGNLKLEIYTPDLYPIEIWNEFNSWMGSLPVGFGTLAPVIYCKDFKLGCVYVDTDVWYNNHDDDNKADKLYVGWIDEQFKKDFSDLQFKLNTVIPEKPISRSYVSTSNGYLNTMKHIGQNEEKVQEYNIVDLYLDHHSERRPIYEANIHGWYAPSSKFSKTQLTGTLMIDTQSWDVAANNNRIKLIAF